MTPGRWVTALILAFVALPLLAVIIFVLSFDPNRYASNIIQAMDAVASRQVTINGPIKLHLSLTPVLSVQDVSIMNPAGFASPKLVHLDELQAQFTLLPLLSHRIDIISLALVNPQIALATNAAGEADWDFSRTSNAVPNPNTGAPTAPGGHGYQIALEAVAIKGGEITFQGAKNGQTIVVAINTLSGQADSVAAPFHFALTAAFNGTPFTLNGTTGPIESFSGIGSGPWPVKLTLNATGLTAQIAGVIASPRTGHGFDFHINAAVTSLTSLLNNTPFIPTGLAPPLQNVTATARIADQGSTIPAIDNLSITSSPANLSAWRPGLSLSGLSISMVSLDQPLNVTASGQFNAAPWSITGKFGAPQALFDPALLPASMPLQGTYPITLKASAGAATLGITGGIATPSKFAGAALGINASIPDLSQFSAFADKPLPAWKNIVVKTTLIDPGGQGLGSAIGLDDISVTMNNAAFGGDARLFLGAAPDFQAAIQAQAINIDALRAAIPSAPAVMAPSAQDNSPAAAASPDYIIPTSNFPLDQLRKDSADIQLAANSLTYNQTNYTSVQTHAILAHGVLTINPLTGELPGGGVTASASLDASKEPAAATVSISAPALALSPLLKSFSLPDTAEGTMRAVIHVTGTGDSPHDLAASMNGQIGLALVNGIVDGALLGKLFGAMLEAVGLPAGLAGNPGPVPVRCFAFRMDSTNGLGTISALTLDSSRLLIQGGGTVNFGTESLGIVLKPDLRIVGSNIGVPVEIGGSFAAPALTVAPKFALIGASQTAIGLPLSITQNIVGPNTLLGAIANATGQPAQTDVCPAALSLSRLGQPGPPAPPMAPPPTGAAQKLLTGPKNLLNALFGK